MRDPRTGHLLPGHANLNPGGRPAGFKALLKELIGDHGREALEKLAAIMRGTATAYRPSQRFGALPGEVEELRPNIHEQFEAAKLLHEALNGKAQASIAISGPEGGPIPVLNWDAVGVAEKELFLGTLTRVTGLPGSSSSGSGDSADPGIPGEGEAAALRRAGLAAD